MLKTMIEDKKKRVLARLFLLHGVACDRGFIPRNAEAGTLGGDLAVVDLIRMGQNA